MFKLSPRLIFILVFLLTFSFYAMTAARYPSGYADSDEFLTVAHEWGVAHPSGYPLLIFLVGLAMRLFSWVNPAFIGNLTASFFQAIGLSALSVSGYLLLTFSSTSPKSSFLKISSPAAALIAVFGSLIVSVSGFYWLYGSVLEANSLTNALVGLTVMFGIYWWSLLKSDRPTLIYFWLTCLFSGLAISHMQTAVLIYPGLLLLLLVNSNHLRKLKLYRKLTTWLLSFSVWGLGFLLPNLLLFWFNLRDHQYSWYFNQNLSGWWRLILRQDYSGYFPEENTSRSAYFLFRWWQIIVLQPEVVRYVLINLSLIGVCLIILGFLYLYRHSRSIFWVVLTWLVVSGPLFLGYMGIPTFDLTNPEYLMLMGVTYRQFLIMHWFLGLYLIFGLAGIYSLMSKYLSSRFRLSIFTAILVCLFVLQAYNYRLVGNKSGQTYAHDFALALLKPVKPQSLIICSSDLACFSLMYATTVEHLRPDVQILTKNDLYIRHYLTLNPQLYGLAYHDNPDFFANLMAWNLQFRPVYVTDPTQYYIDYIGLDANPFYLLPTGYLYEVVKQVPPTVATQFNYTLSQKLTTAKIDPRDSYLAGYRGYFANTHLMNAVLYANYGYPQASAFELQLSRGLFPQISESASVSSTLNILSKNDRYTAGSQVSLQALIDEYRQYIARGNLTVSYEAIRKATYLEPKNSAVRLQLVDIYLKGGYTAEAKVELQEILKYDPQNQAALKQLNQLSQTAG